MLSTNERRFDFTVSTDYLPPVLKGLPMGLSEAAEEAVKRWKFKPATLNGKPVSVYFNLTVNFQLQ